MCEFARPRTIKCGHWDDRAAVPLNDGVTIRQLVHPETINFFTDESHIHLASRHEHFETISSIGNDFVIIWAQCPSQEVLGNDFVCFAEQGI